MQFKNDEFDEIDSVVFSGSFAGLVARQETANFSRNIKHIKNMTRSGLH